MIICAAIRIRFVRDNTPVDAVIPGLRHADCWELMATLHVPKEREGEEGFINNKGVFLNRYEAYEHALACGQLSDTTLTAKEEKGERGLFSEDLY